MGKRRKKEDYNKHVTHFIRDNGCDQWLDPSPDFLSWLEDNKKVWIAFCKLVDKARQRGMERWSARAALEVLRWETRKPIKLNNSLTPYMARLYNLIYCTGEGRDEFLTTRPLRPKRR